MPTSQKRSQVVRQLLQRNINPTSYTSSKVLITPRTPSSSSTIMDTNSEVYYRPPGENSETILFSVLCMHDFVGDDAGLLSFKHGEILDIVKRDDTGWWAAMRGEGLAVGWIPKAYVTPLTEEMAEKLRNTREEVRIYEYEAEQLYNSAPVNRNLALFDPDSVVSSPRREYEDFKTNRSPLAYHRDTLQSDPRRDQNINPYNTPHSSRWRPQPPPSPTSPMPHPPMRSQSQRNPVSSTSAHDAEAGRVRAGSLSSRSLRRKPVMLDDTPTLSRLTTLLESNNTQEINKQANPDIAGSLEALSKRKREERAHQRKASENLKPFIHIRAQNGKPRYLQPQYTDQIDENDKGHIRTATLVALIERLTWDVDPSDLTKLAESHAFTNVFMLTFRTFMTPDQLFDRLVERFCMKPPKSLTEQEYKGWKTHLRIPIQGRILEIFGLWLEDHRLLEEEPQIAQRLMEFLGTINKAPYTVAVNTLMKTVERLTFTMPSQVSTTISQRKARKSKAHKNDLLKLDPVDIAEQLALLEFLLFVKITPQECLTYAKIQTGEQVARLQDFCSTHDKLASWVKSSILDNDILGKRADTVDFWVKVAEKCRVLNNFASMSAIITALSSTVITRLQLTWSHVSRKSNFDLLLRHNEPIGGFAGYRALLQQVDGPCVPFIGMFLTDIVHVQGHLSDQDMDGRICFYRRARWHEIITNMLKFQFRPYSFAISEPTMNFIETRLREGGSRDPNWFWSKSQEVQNSELAHADIRKGLEAAGF